VSERLVEDLFVVLSAAPFGLPCDLIARRVQRRRTDVLAALRADPRFEHRGGGRGSRWSLAAENPLEGSWDGLGRKDRAGVDSGLVLTFPSAAARVRRAEGT
jgi:hypothetical protein